MLPEYGTPGQIRTDTFMVLSHATLPIGVQEYLEPRMGIEPTLQD